MSKLTFVVKGEPNLFEDQEIYHIIPLDNLKELLKDNESLCIASNGNFPSGIPMGTLHPIRGTVISDSAEASRWTIYYTSHSEANQSAGKNWLDRKFTGPYLFASWKKSGIRTFKIYQAGKLLAEYADFETAVRQILPENFKPIGIYLRKYNWITMYCMELKKLKERMALRRKIYELLIARMRALDEENA